MRAVVLFVVAAVAAIGAWFVLRKPANAVQLDGLSDSERAKVAECVPSFRPIVAAVLRRLHAGELGPGVGWFCGEALRSIAKSNQLYAQYLGADGKAGTNDDGPRAAPGGKSPHNPVRDAEGEGAAAIDVNLTRDGKTIASITDHAYTVFGRIVRECGGTWGGDFRTGPADGPHFELTTWRDLAPVVEAPAYV